MCAAFWLQAHLHFSHTLPFAFSHSSARMSVKQWKTKRQCPMWSIVGAQEASSTTNCLRSRWSCFLRKLCTSQMQGGASLSIVCNLADCTKNVFCRQGICPASARSVHTHSHTLWHAMTSLSDSAQAAIIVACVHLCTYIQYSDRPFVQAFKHRCPVQTHTQQRHRRPVVH